MRSEKDFLGEMQLPEEFPFGIHTHRAMTNFSFSGEKIREDLFLALLQVKKAAAVANTRAGLLSETIGNAITGACDELIEKIEVNKDDTLIPDIHPLQGGAGTSTNMAANELIANYALKSLGKGFGEYDTVSPLDHVNLSQSTNDTYPTAVKIAILKGLKKLHDAVEEFLNSLLKKEKEFAHILKIGRTELQDAMPMSLGQEFSAWAEAVARFRWRIDKAVDWIREVNISGTAIGTSINADRTYSLYVMDALREIVKEPLALSRNLIDGTQNIDPIVEVSGLIRTGAVSIKKIASDLKLLSSGPRCGFGEIALPQLQAGSSIMPGKVNPVMLEAAEQVCIHVMGGDAMIAMAAAESNLELPQFLPLISHLILTNIEIFSTLLTRLAYMVLKISANEKRIETYVKSSAAVATLLAPTLGYETVAELVKEAYNNDRPVMDLVIEKNLVKSDSLRKLVSPHVMASPGLPLLEEDDENSNENNNENNNEQKDDE
jgi:aspartate ammonia-lyase